MNQAESYLSASVPNPAVVSYVIYRKNKNLSNLLHTHHYKKLISKAARLVRNKSINRLLFLAKSAASRFEEKGSVAVTRLIVGRFGSLIQTLA